MEENSKERMKERKRQGQPVATMKLVKADTEDNNQPTGICPKCGAHNDPSSLFCEQCGTRLRESRCPRCGAPIDEDADYCERCHQYIDTDHCPFCHAMVNEEDSFCPECGAPLSGIECPVCHTIGRFGFCEACGTPLTDSARQALHEAWEHQPYTEKIRQLEDELEQLWMIQPVANAEQREKREGVNNLRNRVLELMAQEGEQAYVADPTEQRPIVEEKELAQKVMNRQEALQALLDTMAMPPQENPALARNYAMAHKPHVSRLAWKCNYKHALHTSPLGCACPQKGGKWIILDGKSTPKDDK